MRMKSFRYRFVGGTALGIAVLLLAAGVLAPGAARAGNTIEMTKAPAFVSYSLLGLCERLAQNWRQIDTDVVTVSVSGIHPETCSGRRMNYPAFFPFRHESVSGTINIGEARTGWTPEVYDPEAEVYAYSTLRTDAEVKAPYHADADHTDCNPGRLRSCEKTKAATGVCVMHPIGSLYCLCDECKATMAGGACDDRTNCVVPGMLWAVCGTRTPPRIQGQRTMWTLAGLVEGGAVTWNGSDAQEAPKKCGCDTGTPSCEDGCEPVMTMASEGVYDISGSVNGSVMCKVADCGMELERVGVRSGSGQVWLRTLDCKIRLQHATAFDADANVFGGWADDSAEFRLYHDLGKPNSRPWSDPQNYLWHLYSGCEQGKEDQNPVYSDQRYRIVVEDCEGAKLKDEVKMKWGLEIRDYEKTDRIREVGMYEGHSPYFYPGGDRYNLTLFHRPMTAEKKFGAKLFGDPVEFKAYDSETKLGGTMDEFNELLQKLPRDHGGTLLSNVLWEGLFPPDKSFPFEPVFLDDLKGLSWSAFTTSDLTYTLPAHYWIELVPQSGPSLAKEIGVEIHPESWIVIKDEKVEFKYDDEIKKNIYDINGKIIPFPDWGFSGYDWKVEIFNIAMGVSVAEQTGEGREIKYKWDGDDKAGKPAEPGKYKAVLSAIGTTLAGSRKYAEAEVEFDLFNVKSVKFVEYKEGEFGEEIEWGTIVDNESKIGIEVEVETEGLKDKSPDAKIFPESVSVKVGSRATNKGKYGTRGSFDYEYLIIVKRDKIFSDSDTANWVMLYHATLDLSIFLQRYDSQEEFATVETTGPNDSEAFAELSMAEGRFNKGYSSDISANEDEEYPGLLELFKAGGVEVLYVEYQSNDELSDKILIKNQSDLLYFSGHGDQASGCIAKKKICPFEFINGWQQILKWNEVDLLIIAACSVLNLKLPLSDTIEIPLINNLKSTATSNEELFHGNPGLKWIMTGPTVFLGYRWIAPSEGDEKIIRRWFELKNTIYDSDYAWIKANEENKAWYAATINLYTNKYCYFTRVGWKLPGQTFNFPVCLDIF